ncbi:MAG: RNA pseudouridine synthase [Saprospiraceae bacterium]|nr:RNA pseudouridine synthase [Saprospiraceae bacterium]MCF8248632.1 RNA pseudouridine synthase [Saprospiraceae bacterium]MCF8278878.1 RNA pseudouridine synthase [Bacteroidales bacterium]MCF8310678.1 RNA pseudouridine synthase [Saprospiraceae bacterium]MCF8439237.1 RNA pseudouridine synthase [Saprospiraceae bacterium]
MLPILFEDNYLLAVNKPPGMQSDKDKWRHPSAEVEVTVYYKITYPLKKQLAAVMAHRLDRAVSGVLLFAKTPAAIKSLGAQFEERTVGKFYLAILEKCPPQDEGELVHWLKKDNEQKRAVIVNPHTKASKECRLRYKVLQKKGDQCLVEIELLTGRYHQIRVQMGTIGCPVLGDEKYGAKAIKSDLTMIGLHSHRLLFDHPKTGERMEVTTPPPDLGEWRNWK